MSRSKITLYADARLKEVAAIEADKAGISLSEFVVRVLADALDRPDLRVVPRKSFGRPRKT